METVLCAAVGTASHQHGLAACTVQYIGQFVVKWQRCTEPICTESADKKKMFLFNSSTYNHDGQHSNIQVSAMLRTKECCTFLTHFLKKIIYIYTHTHIYVTVKAQRLVNPTFYRYILACVIVRW